MFDVLVLNCSVAISTLPTTQRMMPVSPDEQIIARALSDYEDEVSWVFKLPEFFLRHF